MRLVAPVLGQYFGLPPPPRIACSATLDSDSIRERCLDDGPAKELDARARLRVEGYVEQLLRYNEHTNVYSKTAYTHLPFHVHDSITLGLMIAEASGSGVLDLGSGSGLPSLLIACVNPEMPVFAIESKSRKTRFLEKTAARLELPHYLPLTTNVHEFARSYYCDVDFVTAKAFKPLPEVPPIAAMCLGERALLQVPVSEAQVGDLDISDDELHRRGRFIYFRRQVTASRGTSKRKAMLAPQCEA